MFAAARGRGFMRWVPPQLLLMCSAALCAQPGMVALVNGNVVDVERRTVRAGYTVLIDDGVIRAVGPTRALDLPIGVQIVDCRGTWLLPGMVDSHIHLFQSGGMYARPDIIDLRRARPYESERAWVREHAGDLLARHLAAGVTTVVDLGGPMSNYALRDRFNREALSPAIFLTGPLISTWQPPALLADDPPIIQADDVAQARELVRRQLVHQPDFIKIWYIVRAGTTAADTQPIVHAAIEEAHTHGLRVAVHATQLATAKLAVAAGADILVHGVDDAPVDREFAALLRKRRIPYIPTLLVHQRYDEVLSGQFRASRRDLALANPFALGSLTDLRHLGVAPRPVTADAHESRRRSNLKSLASQGVLIATGTDAGNIGTSHGSSYYDELVAMRDAGLSNWQVIRAATINGARALGRESAFGSIERGKRADLVVLEGNPAGDIRNVLKVRQVVRQGKVLEPSTLIAASPAALVQKQVNAYNLRDLDAFLEPYHDEVQVHSYGGGLRYSGKEAMRSIYQELFDRSPSLHCEILERISIGNVVIDHERVRGASQEPFHVVALYTIEHGRIVRVEFVEP
jgi:imidazolonepropionase-like amidohydrolase